MDDMNDLRIGTSGWSYPAPPGTWTGVFYPARQGRMWRGRKFDELTWYAQHFDTVEVNSSFYRIPSLETTRAWAGKTPRGFEFSMKLFQKLTHPAMFLDRVTRPTTEAADEGIVFKGTYTGARQAAQVTERDIDEFRSAIDPLAEAGKLGVLLAQFPPSFKNEAAAIDYLSWLLLAFRDYKVAVELRHKSWSDDLPATLDVLNASKAGWVQIDEPKFKTSIEQNYLPNVTSFYYLRLHGRNAKAWWSRQQSAERYNYLYSSEELDPFVEIAKAVRTLVKKMYLYTNNHFDGKAVANAVMMKSRLGLPVEGAYPEAFVERFPGLRTAVDTLGVAPPSKATPSLF
jgi:uncharacterized protein YecE (DUF72 family)